MMQHAHESLLCRQTECIQAHNKPVEREVTVLTLCQKLLPRTWPACRYACKKQMCLLVSLTEARRLCPCICRMRWHGVRSCFMSSTMTSLQVGGTCHTDLFAWRAEVLVLASSPYLTPGP
jgi:hypothetical protein